MLLANRGRMKDIVPLAMGAAAMIGLGLAILLVGIGGWVWDARKEYKELH